MIVAIMQPYFFPYIGYFQLMRAVDAFVIYDDTQYMKGGWINRNRIRRGTFASWLTLPVRHASIELAINQREYVLGDTLERARQQLRASYSRAPHYPAMRDEILPLLECGLANVAEFNANLLRGIARRIGIGCEFIFSSAIVKPPELRAQAKIIDLCRRLGANHYVNAIGGAALYDRTTFGASGIRLSFLRTTVAPVVLASGPQHLSILDALMLEGPDAVAARLYEYELVRSHEAGAA